MSGLIPPEAVSASAAVQSPSHAAPAEPETKPQKAMATVAFGMSGSGRSSPGGSPRSPGGMTMSKGNVPFKIPDYVEDAPEDLVLSRPSLTLETPAANPAVAKLKQNPRPQSPELSPSTSQPPSQLPSRMASRHSYGPIVDFSENHVPFSKTPVVAPQESDEDSDDGLFAMPLKAKPAPPSQRQRHSFQGRLRRLSRSTRSKAFIDSCDKAAEGSASVAKPVSSRA